MFGINSPAMQQSTNNSLAPSAMEDIYESGPAPERNTGHPSMQLNETERKLFIDRTYRLDEAAYQLSEAQLRAFEQALKTAKCESIDMATYLATYCNSR